MKKIRQRRSAFQAGYDLGYRLGNSGSGRTYEGASIILPVLPVGQDLMNIVRRLEAVTSHPYEVLLAHCGNPAVLAKKTLTSRAGTVRVILSCMREGMAGALNRAVLAAHGRKVILITGEPPGKEGWMHHLIQELDRVPPAKMLYVYSGELPAFGDLREEGGTSSQIHCLLFDKKLFRELGGWDTSLQTMGQCIEAWQSRIPPHEQIALPVSGNYS